MRVFSFGGGVQSVAVLVLVAQRKIHYDYLLFSNVGNDSENPSTLTYMEEYAKPYAEEFGIELVELQRVGLRGAKKGIVKTLYGELTRTDIRSGIDIPVRMANGAPGQRNCTTDYKIKIISQWTKKHGATEANPTTVGLGISRDEAWRMAESRVPHQLNEYPLIDMHLNRLDCMKIIEGAGLPVPPKSACYFCPFKSPVEWQRMKREEPELFEKSVKLEQTLNERRAMLGKDNVWFHKALQPLDQAVSDQMAMSFDDSDDDHCTSGHCFT